MCGHLVDRPAPFHLSKQRITLIMGVYCLMPSITFLDNFFDFLKFGLVKNAYFSKFCVLPNLLLSSVWFFMLLESVCQIDIRFGRPCLWQNLQNSAGYRKNFEFFTFYFFHSLNTGLTRYLQIYTCR